MAGWSTARTTLWGQFAVFAWSAVLLGATIYTHLLNRTGWVYHLDLDVYLHAVRSWVDGQGLYGVSWTVGPSNASLPFTYPPVSAIVLRPLAGVPYPAASTFMTVGSLVALWVSLYCVTQMSGVDRRPAISIATIASGMGAFAYPVWSNLNLGQINLGLMALVIVDIAAPWRRWPRGVLIGLAGAIKLTPLGLCLYFLLRRDWRALSTTLLTAVLLTGLAWLIDPDISRQYWGHVLDLKESVNALNAVNVSLAGIAERIPSPTVGLVVLAFSVLLVTALAVAAARNQLRHGNPFSAALAVALLVQYVSPVSWFHHWVWAVPVLLALVLGSRTKDPVWTALSALTFVVLYSSLLGSVPGMWVLLLPWGMTVLAAMALRPLDLRVTSMPMHKGQDAQGRHGPAERPTTPA